MPDAPPAVVDTVTTMPPSPGAPQTPKGAPGTRQGPASSPASPARWRPLFLSFGSDAAAARNEEEDDSGGASDEAGVAAAAAAAADNGSSSTVSSSSPAASSSSPNNDPVAEGSREVLIDRLQDVVRHLASFVPATAAGASLSSPGLPVRGSRGQARRRADDRVLSVLHAHVDAMEAVLAAAEADAATAAHSVPSPGLASSPFGHDRTRSSLSSLGTAASTAAVAIEPSSPLSSLRQRTSLLGRPASILTGQQPLSTSHTDAADGGPQRTRERQETQQKPDEGKGGETSAASQTSQTSQTLAIESARLADELAAALARLTTTSREAEAVQRALLNELAAARGRAAALETQLAALERQQQQQQAPKTPTPAAPPSRPSKDDSRNSVFTAMSPSSVSTTAVSTTASTTTTTVTGSHLETLDAELSFLRLQLRAIELRCRTHVPDDADPELAESIANWKADWAALRAQVDEEEHSLRQSMTSGSGGGNLYGFNVLYE